ncbi:M15 family metallopeptidase [Phreatobacter stygius]|uniref:M15 family metallopeptidase n=1 Tax=Phreatobacter stygius TaxID=1940610 RepID=UPI001FE8ED72|nr:M15 family metallopeptidase [Phreatobacter stygius]
MADTPGLPAGFVHLAAIDPSIRQDIRYHGSFNFVGRPIAGYRAAECILTDKAARALSAAQAELASRGLTLVVWDCYRPVQAVQDFMAWSRDAGDDRMRRVFYPQVDKRTLSAEGYISARSTHSRGSTVDVGVARAGAARGASGGQGACTAPPGQRVDDGTLDLGTAFDCFDPRSGLADRRIGSVARANRLMLLQVMTRHGFRGYPREWWHFQLRNEPFPNQTFDFPVVSRGNR